MGVHWKTRDHVWVTQIIFNGNRVYIGSFVNEIIAAKAYDYFALKLYGESAPLNFTKEEAETFDIDKHIHKTTSQFTGISWNTQRSKWRSAIYVKHKTICIGYFENEVEAAFAYDSKVRELGLTNRKLNFP